MIDRMAAGATYHQIGAGAGISAASARECILRALETLRKAIHKEPRYNHTGRARA